ncbi:MAG: GNAT family N-acetyltransferase [Paludibacter sp.]|nr:GNAT family N-acetyltransferase [Paludibacter sp.]
MSLTKTIHIAENILLRPIELSDAYDIFNTIDTQREYLGKWLPFVAFTLKVEDTLQFISSVLNIDPENRDDTFVIQHQGQFAGLIGFKGTDKPNKRTEIGYWLSEPYQKKGIMTLSVQSLIQLAFDEMDIHRIQIKCAVGNIPSRSIPLRLGFKYEGTERDGELLSENLFTDIEVYSKLKTD